jgi:hypothetical protein
MTRRTFLFSGLMALPLLPACTSTHTASRSGEIDLFDGKSLVGWKSVSMDPQAKLEGTWSVRDGLLISTGAPFGFIYKPREFTNFRMVVEYRWPVGIKPGNSGIFSRINDTARALPRCVEVQLMHGSAGDVLTLQGMGMEQNQERFFEVKKHELAGDIRGVKKLQDAEKPPGEWNRVEILAQGPVYTVWINGQQLNKASGIETRPGFVGLQAEGGQIEFRRATITPLP